jgi:hypothetical protein
MSPVPKNLLKFLCASVFMMLLAAALNFVVDPLQLFRPAQLLPAMYSADTRMQDAGLIRSQPFDTVLMGTSLAIHFRQSDVDRILGGRSLKLSMTGSSSREQSFVLEAAMARHPKRVIWQIDDWIFHDAPAPDSDIYLPSGLYRRSVAGLTGYLFSGQMARESLWILARSLPPLQPAVARLTSDLVFKFPIADVDDINSLPRDYDVAAAYNARKALAAYGHITDPVRSRYLADGYDYDVMVRAFERDAIGLIAGHSDVTFDIYFPPYSILQFVAMRDAAPTALKTVYDFAAYALPRLLQHPNVRLYDFRAVEDVTHHLDNYGDVIHHSPAVDAKLLSWLAQRKYAVDRSAPLASLDRLKAQVEAYRLER